MNFSRRKPNLNFCGLSRSGNHAIILWFLNNIGEATLLGKQTYHNTDRKFIYFNNISRAGYAGFDFSIPKYERMFYSWEDVDLDWENTFFIGRDFLNLYASRQKKFREEHTNSTYCTNLTELIDLWVVHHNKPECFYYNFWVQYKWYRDIVAEKLGVPNLNDVTKNVSPIGEGSSFVGLNLDKPTNYLERYKHIKLSDDFINVVLSHKELIKMNKEIYNIDMEEKINGKKA